jgi:hypothetical protein
MTGTQKSSLQTDWADVLEILGILWKPRVYFVNTSRSFLPHLITKIFAMERMVRCYQRIIVANVKKVISSSF